MQKYRQLNNFGQAHQFDEAHWNIVLLLYMYF
nr:MAG TPA: hypothetical protein [Caudoviricetes sp.]